jgi:hypothetical protein
MNVVEKSPVSQALGLEIVVLGGVVSGQNGTVKEEPFTHEAPSHILQ